MDLFRKSGLCNRQTLRIYFFFPKGQSPPDPKLRDFPSPSSLPEANPPSIYLRPECPLGLGRSKKAPIFTPEEGRGRFFRRRRASLGHPLRRPSPPVRGRATPPSLGVSQGGSSRSRARRGSLAQKRIGPARPVGDGRGGGPGGSLFLSPIPGFSGRREGQEAGLGKGREPGGWSPLPRLEAARSRASSSAFCLHCNTRGGAAPERAGGAPERKAVLHCLRESARGADLLTRDPPERPG